MINLLFIKKDFVLNKALLYTDLENNVNVTKFFKYNLIDKIDTQTIQNIYTFQNMKYVYDSNIRLKLFFSFKNNNYIIYFSILSIFLY